jgi:hypothetical protein
VTDVIACLVLINNEISPLSFAFKLSSIQT